MNGEQVKIGSIRVSPAKISEVLSSNAEGSGYVGIGDTMLDFGVAKSFADEDSSGREFQIKLISTGTSDVTVALSPAFFTAAADIKDASGAAVDAILVEGVVINVSTTHIVNASGYPRTITSLLGYSDLNPMRIKQIKFKVDDADQLDEAIVYRSEHPFGQSADDRRVPASYSSSKDNNEKVITIDDIEDWVFGGSQVWVYKIRAGRTVTITLRAGAILDAAKALNNKANLAITNLILGYSRASQK